MKKSRERFVKKTKWKKIRRKKLKKIIKNNGKKKEIGKENLREPYPARLLLSFRTSSFVGNRFAINFVTATTSTLTLTRSHDDWDVPTMIGLDEAVAAGENAHVETNQINY